MESSRGQEVLSHKSSSWNTRSRHPVSLVLGSLKSAAQPCSSFGGTFPEMPTIIPTDGELRSDLAEDQEETQIDCNRLAHTHTHLGDCFDCRRVVAFTRAAAAATDFDDDKEANFKWPSKVKY